MGTVAILAQDPAHFLVQGLRVCCECEGHETLRTMALLSGSSTELPIWFVLFCVSSVGMQLLNKAIAVSFKDVGVHSMDNLLMVWQQISAILLNFFCITFIGGSVWNIKRVTLEQVKRIVPSTVV